MDNAAGELRMAAVGRRLVLFEIHFHLIWDRKFLKQRCSESEFP